METFGRYQLVRKLATGGMAEIHLARQSGPEGFEKLVVVKRILPHLAENEEFVAMFLHEARIAVRLNHPNIVQIYDLGQEAGSYFIAMEYIAGDDIRRIWKRADAAGTSLPIPLACRIVMEAAAGLFYAHKKLDEDGRPLEIIHRDVSPQNILASFEGAVKVVDFGIAKAADQATVTRSGVLKGKYSYMSPEQASGKDIDHRTDQFALGVVLWELLTSQRLFKRATEIQTLAAVAECRVQLPSAANPRVPKELDAIVMRALARDPDARYSDLRGLQLALDEWLRTCRLPSSSAHLAEFLHTLYGDRADADRAPGGDERSGSRSEIRHGRTPARRSSTRGPGEEGETRNGRARRFAEPIDEPNSRSRTRRERSSARATFDDQPHDGTMTGSSVSRLVLRLSARKKAAIGVGVTAGLVGVAAVFFQLQQVNSTTREPVDLQTGNPGAEVRPRAGGFAGLHVVTDPPGATLLIDARPIEGLTPVVVGELALGEHQIFVKLDGHEPVQQTVALRSEGEVVQVRVVLPALLAAAAKEDHSLEPGLADQEPLVQKPERSERADRSRRQLPKTTLAVVPAGTAHGGAGLVQPSAPAATGMGSVSIDSDPAATVWEGPNELGRTPLKLKLSAGPHQLVLVNREIGLERAVNLVVTPEENAPQRFRFETGEVQLIVKPWADVYLRKRKVGTTPMPKVVLLEGEHIFTFANDELGKTKRVGVTVKAGQTIKVNVDLMD